MSFEPLYPHDRTDPDVWTALELDSSIPLSFAMKRAWMKDGSRWTRQFLLPLLRPFLYLAMILIQVYKVIFPRALTSSRVLHWWIRTGLKTFVTPEGNFLFLRHCHLGSQVLEFLCSNIAGVDVRTESLYPANLDDVKDDLLIKHDHNMFNFVIDLNTELRRKGLKITAKKNLSFDCLRNPPLRVEDFPRRWTNFIDIQTATDLFAPVFQLLLTDREFWRSCHSLQFDETIGIYFAQLLGLHNRLFLVNNRHPMIPNMTLECSIRLSLHSYSTEVLHGLLMQLKEQHIRESKNSGFHASADSPRPSLDAPGL
jgi:hypothetical protein